MHPPSPRSFAVTFSDAPAAAALEPEWRALEARADASFFTSWTWIGAWLRQLPSEVRPQLARVTSDSTVVGLALFTCRLLKRRHGLVRSRGLFLHATGDPRYDDITVEYNGILAARELCPAVESALLRHLASQAGGWDELHMESLAMAPRLPDGGPRLLARHMLRPSYHVDLAKVRAHGGGYLALLRQQPRYSVRRTLKGCTQHGAVLVEAADTPATARRFLDGLKALHTTYWRSRGEAGAFASPFANVFHDDLLSSGFADGEIQLLHVRAGERTVGYLYNFVHGGRVMNYQSGINYALLPASDSPGLAAHAMAIEFNAGLGHAVYDFMVGDQHYKRALSTDTSVQHWLVLQRDRLRFRIENALRSASDRLRERMPRTH